MHKRNDGRYQATVTWSEDNDLLTEWIEDYKADHGASDSQAIKYALREYIQLETANEDHDNE